MTLAEVIDLDHQIHKQVLNHSGERAEYFCISGDLLTLGYLLLLI